MQVGDAATLTVSVCRLRIAVVIFSSGHALCCVWLHVQDPRKLQIKKYIRALIFSGFLILTAPVVYITAMVYQVLQMYSVSLNMSEMTVIK